MGTLNVGLLGPMQVTHSGEAAVGFEVDAARALVAYLAVTAEHATPREVLAGLLWPEWPDTEALRNLRAALFRLRSAIGDREADPPYLLISRSELQLNADSDVWVDVHAFNEHLRTVQAHDHPGDKVCSVCVAHLRAATELYRGDFMAGFSYPSAEFEGWMVTQRESFHVQVLDALGELSEVHEQRGAHRESLECARRQIELEPWRESAHQQAMRALVSSGQRAAALAQYERCVEILDAELGIEPEAATRELYEQIRRGDVGPPAPVEVGPVAVRPPRREPSSALSQAVISDQPVVPGEPSPGAARLPSEPSSGRIEGSTTRAGPLPGGERRTVTFLSVETGGIGNEAAGVDLEMQAETLHEILSSRGQRRRGMAERSCRRGRRDSWRLLGRRLPTRTMQSGRCWRRWRSLMLSRRSQNVRCRGSRPPGWPMR